MSQKIDIEIDIDKEIEQIEGEIEAYNRRVEDLTWRRSELLCKKQDLEICELIDCIVEKGITINEALEILNGVDYIRRNFIRN